ncbi:MAG: AmmeMemoRadiSam system protein A [Syntrophomonadaceae bacterium]|nr:AmmeMemoRadiSam system protein A [Syntrophomonadaceae bacterium]
MQNAADKLGKNVAIIASGDMSHRLKDDGPYNFHPDGPKFDLLIKEYLQVGDVEAVLNMPESLCENAGECGFRSIVIMLGSMDGYEIKSEIYAYEGPFGVGYLTAGFTLGDSKPSLLDKMMQEKIKEIKKRRDEESAPVKWARLVLENYVRDGVKPDLPAELEALKTKRGAVFVSLKKDGNLRGCIGTIEPVHANLAEEIANNAISAGLRDPRFLPVEETELKNLIYSVDILSSPEECTKEDLDPSVYGVIVSKGSRRGLLLPALEGVDTVEKQLAIALEKARIAPHEDYKIQRFKVERYY